MHDAGRVGFGDGVTRLNHVFDGDFDWSRSLPFEQGREVLSAKQLHDHERRAGIVRADVVNPNDVVAREAGSGLTFSQETRGRLSTSRLVETLDGEQLDRDRLTERHVLRGDHDAHASATDQPIDAVLSRNDLSRMRLRRTLVRIDSYVAGTLVTHGSRNL
jgi:Tfp pilus assembly protein PilZ